MKTKTFKPGQAVFYKPRNIFGDIYAIRPGIVKRMSEDGTKAFVWYHSGCTAALTPIEYLEATEPDISHQGIHRGCEECKSHEPDKLMKTLLKN